MLDSCPKRTMPKAHLATTGRTVLPPVAAYVEYVQRRVETATNFGEKRSLHTCRHVQMLRPLDSNGVVKLLPTSFRLALE